MVLRFEKYGTENVDMMMNNGQPTDELIDKLSLNLEENHAVVFHHLLKVEEIQMKIDIRYYDMEGVTMNEVQHYFALKVSSDHNAVRLAMSGSNWHSIRFPD